MTDKILWEFLEELTEPETPWCEWCRSLSGWYCFNVFYIHYLKVEDKRAKSLKCMELCDHDCPRIVVENSPSDITAVCPQEKAVPVRLKFRETLIYSLRRETFHRALCTSLQIERPSGNRWSEFGSTWYLGDYYAATGRVYYPVYLTYQAIMLPETISSLCRLHQEPFLLMAPTRHGLTPEAQQLLDKNSSVLFSMEAELTLQSDGSFKTVRSISECMKSSNHSCPQATQKTTLPIEAYKYLVYKK